MGDIIIGDKYEFRDGSRMVNIQVNMGSQPTNGNHPELDKQLLARAIENCQTYFWAKASYAVVYCICRDKYEMQPNQTAFEEMVEGLPYKRKRNFVCPTGTIANAISDNSIYKEHISEWDNRAQKRVLILRDQLLKELKL